MAITSRPSETFNQKEIDMTDQNTKKQPDFHVFQVKDIGEGTSRWTQIGAAWANKDGEGFNISLDSLPLDGKLTLRKPRAEEQPM